MAKYHLEISTRRSDAMSELQSDYKLAHPVFLKSDVNVIVDTMLILWMPYSGSVLVIEPTVYCSEVSVAVLVLKHPCWCGNLDPYAYLPCDV